MKAVTGNTLTALNAIAASGTLKQIAMSAQQKAGAIGALLRGGAIAKTQDGAYALTAEGKRIAAQPALVNVSPRTAADGTFYPAGDLKYAAASNAKPTKTDKAKPKGKAAAKAKAEKPAKAKAAGHGPRTEGYVKAVRKAMPSLKKTDEEIAAVVWRVASDEKAIAKAKEAFK